ncbi:MAG: hypothetical protein Fur0020_09300 [Thermodesulfovibrionia bacterium]
MVLHHVGIVNRSEEDADRFYAGILGLMRAREYVVSAELSEQLFSIRKEINAIVYEGNGLRIEVFICPEFIRQSDEIRHIGVLVEDLQSIIDKAMTHSAEYIIGKTKDKTVHFLKDYSGNMIEIKQC